MSIADLVVSKNALIFDLFHTLTSTETGSKYGMPSADTLGIDRVEWHDFLVNNTRERLVGNIKNPKEIIKYIAHSIDPNIPMEKIELAAKNRVKRFTDALLNIPEETLSVLNELKKRDKKLALLSNADVIESAAWKFSPLFPFFDVVIFSCEVGMVKPENEIYQLTLKKLNESAENTLFIGDGGSNELTAAAENGIIPVLYTGIIKNLWPDKIEQLSKDVEYQINSFEKLL